MDQDQTSQRYRGTSWLRQNMPEFENTRIRTASTVLILWPSRISRDEEVASQQIRIEQLPPTERKQQDIWALEQFDQVSPCPKGFSWQRVPGEGFYRCHRGSPLVTDELLVSAHGEYYDRIYHGGYRYSVAISRAGHHLTGPFYVDPNAKWSTSR